MKYLSYLSSAVGRIPCYLTNEPSKWSYQTIMDNVIRRTKTFLRLFDRPKTRYADFKPPRQRIFIRPPLLHYRQRFSYLKPGYLKNVTSRWYSNSLAAALNRGTSRALFRGGCGPVFGFTGFVLATKPSLLTEQEELEGLAFEIRESFSKFAPNLVTNQDANVECVPDMHKVSVNDLEFGELLGKGCNAAVYSARWKYQESPVLSPVKPDTDNETIISHSEVEQVNVNNSNLNCKQDPLNQALMVKELPNHNLAVKLMFNYCAESNAFAIFRAMYKEAFPARYNNWITGIFSPKTKPVIPPHPNVIEMYTAFADQMPLLNDAISCYPHALPSRLIKEGGGRNMTLFLVMKRYHCTLKEYLKHYQPSIQTSLLILCQLLEGLAHLLQNNIAHRDLKTDNILVDLSNGLSAPVLVITDFGSCSETLQMSYPSEEIDRGGNLALMAPEVLTADAGPTQHIDYSRSDIWTLGTIAYEIFGQENPFYENQNSNLQSTTYNETDLPLLPPEVPLPIQRLIMDMLRKDPKLRPSPTFAASVCQLLLHAPKHLFTIPPNKKNLNKITKWLFLTSAQTFLEACGQKGESMSVQLQLRLVFCRRIFFSELLKTLHYIMEDYP